MKALKVVGIVALAYVGVVVVFESLLGVVQPRSEATMTITTFDDAGEPHERVVSRLEHEGRLYVAANHWPRAWYRQALANPRVDVTIDGETREHRAVEIPQDEYREVDEAHALGPFFRVLTGFPPREILRLDPTTEE